MQWPADGVTVEQPRALVLPPSISIVPKCAIVCKVAAHLHIRSAAIITARKAHNLGGFDSAFAVHVEAKALGYKAATLGYAVMLPPTFFTACLMGEFGRFAVALLCFELQLQEELGLFLD